MAGVDWKQVETIIDEVLELPSNQRLEYINHECAGNDALKSEVTLLLESIYDSEGWLNSPDDYGEVFYDHIADDIQQIDSPHSLVGHSVGAYVIEEKLDEGGMGTVYLAERSDGAFEHRVAIKVIRKGMASPDNVRRFEQERNILANLNHPGVAKLFDGGITEEGSPYLIMEYIDGITITDYCQNHRLSLQERLSLFKKVLAAVRHAHENAIIHRDLKPDNILVTPKGEVKILDFGISKMLDEDSSNHLTQTQGRLLTPRYAAPEQIKQQPITTVTDLYALGILFYQLLCGSHPFDLEDSTRYELEQTILTHTPPSPGTKVQDSFPVTKAQLKGDLDAIALKAIRKEPAQRYRMASEFLEELNHFQQGLPVSALKDSYRYRSQKFIQRHRTKFAVVAGITLLTIGLVTFYTWKVTQERNYAQLEAQKAEIVTQFLIDLFQANDPNNSQGDTLTARQLLERGEQKINELDNQPAIKSRILEVLGNIYGLLSYPEKADSLQTISMAIKKDLYQGHHPELASIYTSLASTRQVLGQYNNALELLDTTLQFQQELFGIQSKEVGKSLRLIAENLKEVGKVDSAYQTILSSQRIYESLGDTSEADFLKVLMEKGAITVAQGKLSKSEDIWRHSLQLSENLFPSPHPKILSNINGLANVLKELEYFSEAEQLYMRSVIMTKQLYGDKHINTAVTLNNVAGLYYYTEEYQKSDTYYSESYDLLKDILGKEHPFVISTLYNQANLKADMGEFAAAEKLYRQVIELDIAQFGEVHPHVASDMTGLATLYKNSEKFDQAITYYNKSLEIRRKVYDNPNHPYISYNERSLAEIMIKLGNYSKAEKLYKKVLTSYVISFGQDHDKVYGVATDYSKLLAEMGDDISADSLISVAN